MKKSRQYKYDVIENWLRSTSANSLCELKEKCAYYRETTNSDKYYPYEGVVWVYNKGPDGRQMSYEAIAQELGVTPKKVHESKWIGLYLLGYRAVEHPPRTKRVATEIENVWQEYLAELKFRGKKEAQETVEKPKRSEPKVFWRDKILADTLEHEKLLKAEIAEILSVLLLLKKDVAELEVELQRCQKATEILGKICKCLSRYKVSE